MQYRCSVPRYSRLIRASSPMPHCPPGRPCFWISNANSAPRELASSSLYKLLVLLALLSLLARSLLSAPDRSVTRFRIKGVRRKDFEDVECTDKESSAALELASSLLRSSEWLWSAALRVGTMVSLLELYGCDRSLVTEGDSLTSLLASVLPSWSSLGWSSSTNSASRYHFLLLVQRLQPSWPR
jgi:hypothetical protein